MRFMLAIIVSTLALAGCSTGPSRPFIHEEKEVRVFSYSPELQTLFIKGKDMNERLCDSREADAAETGSVGFSLGIGPEKANEGVSKGAVSLGGRSPAVLITREFLYRACEVSLNLNLSKEETLQVYYRFLDAAVEVAKAQSGTGASALAASGGTPAGAVETENTSSTTKSPW